MVADEEVKSYLVFVPNLKFDIYDIKRKIIDMNSKVK